MGDEAGGNSMTTQRSGPDRTVYTLPGLPRPVEIVVDRWGVPHIYSEDTYDAFRAQGFNVARDRLWQIDFWRRRGVCDLGVEQPLGRHQQGRQRFAHVLAVHCCNRDGLHRPLEFPVDLRGAMTTARRHAPTHIDAKPSDEIGGGLGQAGLHARAPDHDHAVAVGVAPRHYDGCPQQDAVRAQG
ncbi:MAG TPA: penicillin acylase family protein [Trebonia sp.]|nr:penicillin acylase family protein [Trebonia sp.]